MLPTQYTEPWAAGPDDPYHIDPCEECGAEDAEYGVHKSGCPSGYPTIDATDRERDALQGAVREFEDER
jgi:hypothetical protein